MKRFLFVLCAAMGCVPASEERPPAGAAGFDTQPSAATKGERFTTRDGWTIEIQRFILQLSVAASPSSRGYGTSEPWLFDSREPTRIYARALPTGTSQLTFNLYGRYLSDSYNDYSENVTVINVDAATEARFDRRADDYEPESGYEIGPSILLTLRAEGRGTIALDLALNATLSGLSLEGNGVPVLVPKDDIGIAHLGIVAESLFPQFDDIAEADADSDRNVTARELQDARVLQQLETRLSAVFEQR